VGHEGGLEAEIAVVMPHRNGEAYLRQAVESILRQEAVSLRLYLVDDASSTGAWLDAVAPWLGDPRLVALQTDRNVGPFRITNWLLDNTKEPYIVFQDADDFSAPGRLRMQLEFLKRGMADIAGSAFHLVAEDGTLLRTKKMPRNANLEHLRGKEYAILHSSAMMSRRVLDKLRGFDGRDHGVGADTEFYLRATFACRIRNLPQPLYFYRQHKDSLTNAPATGRGSPAREAFATEMYSAHGRRRNLWLAGTIWPPLRRRIAVGNHANDVPFNVLPIGTEQGGIDHSARIASN
jgi:glycosyltransferase involved in cell wall biosynthesis